ncbi:MAG: glycerophosphodiester phosphodiesterase family protein [Bacteroidota bacterium]
MQPFRPKPSAGISPYVIAHRGISGKAPENTPAAFSPACLTPGIDMIELDVRLSKEEEVIVLHDRSLQRTTTGNGPARNYLVSELKQFDAGSWFNPSFSQERIPLLRDVLSFVDRRRWIDIELKSDFLHPEPPGFLERKVLDVVRELGMLDQVMFSSFNHGLMGTLRKIEPRAVTGVLYNMYRDFGRPPSKLAGRVGASVIVCSKYEFTERMLQNAHQHGLALYVYTLNDQVSVRKMMELGVDGILSDNADEIVPIVRGIKQ